MRASRRRALVVLLAALAALVGALLLGWFPQEPARRFVERRLQQALGPDARVGALRVWPGRLYAEIDGLVIDTPAYRLDARTLRVALNRQTLFGPAVLVRSIEADGVSLLIRGDAPATPASRAAALGTLAIESLRVTGASLRFEGQAVGGAVSLDGVTLQGAVGRDALDVAASGGRWDGRGDPLRLGPARARLRISPALDLHVEAFEAGLERSRISASGPLGSVNRLEPDLAWSATVDVAEIASPAGLGDASGSLRAQGTFRLPPEGPALTADLSGEQLSRGEWSAETVQGRVTHEGGRTTASIDARMLGGAAKLDATLADAGVRGRVEATGVDLARLRVSPSLAGRASATVDFRGDPARAIEVDARVTADGRNGSMPFQVELLADGPIASNASRIDLDWAVSGRGGDPSASFRLQGSGRAHGPLPPAIDGRLDGVVDTPRTGALPFEAEVGFAGGEIRVTGSVRGLGEPVALHAALEGERFSRLELSGAGIALDRLLPGLSGQARVEVAASGRLESLSGRASVQLEDAAWRGVQAGPATVELTAQSGAARFELHVPDWSVSGQGEIAADRQRTLRGRIDLRDTPLERLEPLLPKGPPMTGAVTAGIDLDVPMARPAEGEVRVEVGSTRRRPRSAARPQSGSGPPGLARGPRAGRSPGTGRRRLHARARAAASDSRKRVLSPCRLPARASWTRSRSRKAGRWRAASRPSWTSEEPARVPS